MILLVLATRNVRLVRRRPRPPNPGGAMLLHALAATSGVPATRPDRPDLFTIRDTFLPKVTVAAFGLTLAKSGLGENLNTSCGDSQENVV